MENEKLNTQKNEQDNRYNRRRHPHNNGLGALVIIVAGIVLLLSRIPQTAYLFPNWLFDWPVILIIIGLFIGARHGFRNSFGWVFLILFGSYYLLKDQHLLAKNVDVYIFPVFLILFGFFLLIRRNRCRNRFDRRAFHFEERMRSKREFWQQYRRQRFDNNRVNTEDTKNNNEDFINVNSVFGSSQKTMFTKTFKGGNISATFGGTELNLSQCDMEDAAILNVDVTFGGAEISVPANWTIQNELNAVMGGIEDKRRISASVVPPKILILRGSILCGGVEIKN